MKDTILMVALIWTVSALVMRKQVFEEGVPKWITLLRFVLSPLLLVFVFLEWLVFGIKSSLRD